MIMRSENYHKYAILPIEFLDDARLSWEAKGLLAFLLWKGWTDTDKLIADQYRRKDETAKRALEELMHLEYITEFAEAEEGELLVRGSLDD